MLTIYKREFFSYFRTPVGYVFIGVFSALSGLIFYLYNLADLSGDILTFMSQLTALVMLLSPILTMRILCDDRQKHTEKLLLSSPVPLPLIVLGKYLAAASVLFIAILLTNICTIIVMVYGTVYLGEWFVGYLGFTLQALSFLALDMFLTSFARSQASAAFLAFGGNFLLWVIDLIADSISWDFLASSLQFISLYDRYEPFILGQLSYSSVCFFLFFIAVFVIATMRLLDARRFSRGGGAA